MNNTWKAFASAFLLTVAAGILWGFLAGITLESVSEITRESRVRQRHERIVIHEDGTPFVQITEYGGSYHRKVTHETLDGQPAPKGLKSDDDIWAPGVSISRSSPWYRFQRHGRFHHILSSDDRSSYWYLVRDEASQTMYFVLYGEPANRVQGYFGISGFQEGVPALQDRFALKGFQIEHPRVVDGTRSLLVQSQQRLYDVDLTGRRIRPVLPDETIVAANAIHSQPDRWRQIIQEANCLVATDRRFVVLDADAAVVRSFQLPDHLRNRDFTVYGITDGTAVGRTYKGDVDSVTTTLTWFDAQGTTLRTEEWSIPTGSSPTLAAGWVLAFVVPAPVVDLGFGTLVLPTLSTLGMEDHVDKSSIIERIRAGLWLPFSATLLFSATLAWHADRRMRRYGLSRSYAWIAFILLFGLPGYLGWRFHCRWPARVPCPHCNLQTPCNQPACTSCGADFPPPKLTGTEVFA